MSFALKYGSFGGRGTEAGLIYFDAVTQYGRDFSGQVSSHPIANGSLISDHYTRQNPKYHISAVISGVDISTWTYLIRDSEGMAPNNIYDNAPVSVSGVDSSIVKYLPDVFGQFFELDSSVVKFDTARTDYTPQVEASLIRLMEGFIYDPSTNFWRSNVQLLTLYEFDGVLMKNMIPNLVATSMRFQEDVNTGDALTVSIDLEQISYSFLQRVKLDQTITEELSDAASDTVNKPPADGTGSEVEDYDIGTRARSAEEALRKRMAVNLPLHDEAHYSYNASLEDTSYKVEMNYNTRTESWAYDLYTRDNQPVLLGQSIVPNYPIASDYDIPLSGDFWLKPLPEVAPSKAAQYPRNLNKYYSFAYEYDEVVS